MKEKIKTMMSLIIILICLPYLVTFVVQGDFLNNENQIKQKEADDETEQLIFTIANEMSFTYEKEALKAQSVIARTNLAYAREHDLAEPKQVEPEELREALGIEKYQKMYELLKSCVEETAGEVITYDGELVQLPYHLVSAGQTREDASYLKSVSSMEDLQSERFLKVTFYHKKQLLNQLKAAFPDLDFSEDEIESQISITKRDSASYVLTVEMCGKEYSGEEFCQALALNSTCFSIKRVDNQIRIVTKGYGHGYGMSQFGANEMAKSGKDYKEILNYYYNEIKIG